jgi:hypothetical protein
MSELKRYLVIFVALVAFLLAAYIQGGGTWRGPHNLRTRRSCSSRWRAISRVWGKRSSSSRPASNKCLVSQPAVFDLMATSSGAVEE